MQHTDLLIGAPTSGTGKTTFTIGLLRSLKRRGNRVQPFKCGPDYIDTKFHREAAGTDSINLDLFMSSPEHVKSLYNSYSLESDISVVEGVMGLFDGASKMSGSSAAVAELLDIPVLLIVSGKAVAYSVAPLISGFVNFHKGVKIAGVIFNFVSSESHYARLKEACDDIGVESFGYLPKSEDLVVPSRHLGLNSDFNLDAFADGIADIIDKHIDIPRLLEVYGERVHTPEPISKRDYSGSRLKIAVARDEAFSFTYYENIRALSEMGEVIFFSPLKDEKMPEADMLYLAGGYPELHLSALSENRTMLNSINSFAKAGGRILGECGGMIYLCNSVIDKSGDRYSLAGVIDQTVTMENMRLHLGYRRVVIDGREYKGHEFHYTSICDSGAEYLDAEVFNARGGLVDTKVYCKNNVVASYIHFYWGEQDILSLFK